MDPPFPDTRACATLLVDQRLRVHAQQIPEPAGVLPLQVADGRLQAGTAVVRRRIQAGVGVVLAGERGATGLVLPRPGRLPLTLRISIASPSLALLELQDPHATQVEPGLLQDLFGLTRAEAAVASMVCDGLATGVVAAALGVQVNTVHTHVKRVLGKCGVPRQAQLVALLLRSVAARPAPVRHCRNG